MNFNELNRLAAGEHHDPHSILGAHPVYDQVPPRVVIRAFHPEASAACLCLISAKGKSLIPMTRIHGGGIFSLDLIDQVWPFEYKLRFYFADNVTWETIDPYRFLPTLTDLDIDLAAKGRHFKIYEKLGAHPGQMEGIDGVSFAVWSPNAKRVSVIGDFNHWDGRIFPMRAMGSSGIWEVFIPGLREGMLYKFEIKDQYNNLRIKTDPYSFAMEMRPQNASIISNITNLNKYQWHDLAWLEARSNLYQKPMAIYEVHPGSWLRIPEEGNRWLTYQELAARLIEHCHKFGFTHIELMPISEHPFDGSWGYQVTGYFAPTSRFGSPDDFKTFVDMCHQNGLGVILDWVPSHFPKDDNSLRRFDGTALYEYDDPKKGEQREWGTLVFNFERNEVSNFLIANALFWLKVYHLDGLRVDAVASMIYLDYNRQQGEWLPNKLGGKENLEAILFLQNLNQVIADQCPGCVTIAEESTAFPDVCKPAQAGGLGFTYKWDMGWMNDTLSYFKKDPIYRRFHHNNLTFSMWYAYSENFILPLSHDEVVYGKKSLLRKMPGSRPQQLANLRLLLCYLYTHPGKKLLFMGTELAPDNEWNHDTGLDWSLANDPDRYLFQKFFKGISHFYLEHPELWELDHQRNGFTWIDCHDSEQSLLSYIRRGEKGFLICVLNFTPVVRYNYRLGVPLPDKPGVSEEADLSGKADKPGEADMVNYVESFNSDLAEFGGSNIRNNHIIKVEPIPHHGLDHSITLTLPPLAGLMLKPVSNLNISAYRKER